MTPLSDFFPEELLSKMSQDVKNGGTNRNRKRKKKRKPKGSVGSEKGKSFPSDSEDLTKKGSIVK